MAAEQRADRCGNRRRGLPRRHTAEAAGVEQGEAAAAGGVGATERVAVAGGGIQDPDHERGDPVCADRAQIDGHDRAGLAHAADRVVGEEIRNGIRTPHRQAGAERGRAGGVQQGDRRVRFGDADAQRLDRVGKRPRGDDGHIDTGGPGGDDDGPRLQHSPEIRRPERGHLAVVEHAVVDRDGSAGVAGPEDLEVRRGCAPVHGDRRGRRHDAHQIGRRSRGRRQRRAPGDALALRRGVAGNRGGVAAAQHVVQNRVLLLDRVGDPEAGDRLLGLQEHALWQTADRDRRRREGQIGERGGALSGTVVEQRIRIGHAPGIGECPIEVREAQRLL